ncbi:ABC transporter ATP-binding protein [Gryllotalpicola kribbensis]|jgi:peptide/nickel transport system ATP-binding protein|uniref:ABC transporter ATP-binding protein n=1 Tax=Gryllotalpicola kribbensis TaxID=993084 RepID=A0ABP8AKK8_9MICO
MSTTTAPTQDGLLFEGAALAPGEPLLEIDDLRVSFRTQSGGDFEAVRGVSFTVNQGETVAIVGESGSGKSTTATAVIDLLAGNGKVTGGSAKMLGVDLTKLSDKQMQSVRGRVIGYVPQDPMSNLNPVWSVGFQVEEAIKANNPKLSRGDVKKRAIEVLKEAGLGDADKRMKQYPHQFSGGMRQRVLIGIGLSSRPRLLVADEPTSALDVTVQRVILDHLQTLTRDYGTSVLLITHDLGLAAERAEKLVVMYRGQVVEAGPSKEILADPRHPYTQRLVAAAPSLASRRIQSQKSPSHVDTSVRVAEGAQTAAIDQIELAAERREAQAADAKPLITFENVTKVYKIRQGGFTSIDLKAVDDISFSIPKGTTTALVGESGSGKSTASKLLLNLEPVTSGTITVDGQDVSKLRGKELLRFRRRVQPVFQDPYGSLNPMHNIESIIAEPLLTHGIGNSRERARAVRELLEQVALPQSTAGRYPNELSGGQRQRIAVARALALKPDIIVLDEAVSALDVLVQGQILNLLTDLQAELGLTYLFVTHDLAVVRLVADNVCVMEKGRLVETGTTDEIFDAPREDYTRRLLDAIPGAGFEFGA